MVTEAIADLTSTVPSCAEKPTGQASVTRRKGFRRVRYKLGLPPDHIDVSQIKGSNQPQKY